MAGKTSFIIAHRLSTIKSADWILVMNQGNVLEQGTHDSLMEQNGFYANLYQSQFADSEEGRINRKAALHGVCTLLNLSKIEHAPGFRYAWKPGACSYVGSFNVGRWSGRYPRMTFCRASSQQK